MFISASPVPQTGVPASVTQPSKRHGVCGNHGNFKKDREFVGITVLLLDEKIP
uniref:Uncharacterized protein n=1 Tax=Brassica oleracea var. oleracea TaxID=109376 RepID=A0A0D3D7Y9_BRAOL